MRLFASLALTTCFAGALFAQPAAAPAKAPAAPAAPARENGLYATIQVSISGAPAGSIVFRMNETEAPNTVRNFVDLALGRKEFTDPKTGARVKRPFYNGLNFHRAVPGFMIQGGDPLGNGQGRVDSIRDEFHPTLKFDGPGRVAMANRGPDTSSCQFFIMDAPRPDLNGRYSIFGKVVSGQPLVTKIAALPKGANPELLAVPVTMTRVTFERVGPVPPGGIVLGGAPAAPAKAPSAPVAPPKASQKATTAPNPATKK